MSLISNSNIPLIMLDPIFCSPTPMPRPMAPPVIAMAAIWIPAALKEIKITTLTIAALITLWSSVRSE
jgi:hypothetical protein